MRLLLVDDDGDSRTIYRTMLEATGYEVLECADGEEALRLAREYTLEIILLDMELPGKSGWEIARALQQDSSTAQIPIVAVSAHALAKHETRAREAGCVGYLTKPIEPTALAEAVERILRSPPGESGGEPA